MNINEVSHAAAASLSARQGSFAPAQRIFPGTDRPGESSAASRTVQDSPVQSAGREAVSDEKLQAAVEKIQEFVSAAASDIKFSIDEDSGRTVVKVVERGSQEVIRQIPSQEMLELAKALDKLQGLLIRQQA